MELKIAMIIVAKYFLFAFVYTKHTLSQTHILSSKACTKPSPSLIGVMLIGVMSSQLWGDQHHRICSLEYLGNFPEHTDVL